MNATNSTITLPPLKLSPKCLELLHRLNVCLYHHTLFIIDFPKERKDIRPMCRPYEKPFDDVGTAVSAFIIFTFLILGITGNALTIAVITTSKKLNRNIFMNFIISLCVSDLISALISWLFLYRRTWGFDVWGLPDVLCKIYWSVDIMTSYVTAGHILSFALLRFLAIRFQDAFHRIELLHARIWIALIWLICFCSGLIPSWIIFGAGIPDRFSRGPEARWPACTILREQIPRYEIYQKVAFPIFIYIPTIGVVCTCALVVGVFCMLKRKKINKGKKTRQKEKNAVLQLVLIIMSFLIGYIPFTAYEFWSIQTFPNTRYYHVADYWFGMIEYMFLRFSECLNPLFYNLGSAKVRKCTKIFVQDRILCCFASMRTRPASRTITSMSTEMQ